VAVLLVCILIGHYSDQFLKLNKPWCTLAFAMIAVISTIYLLIKKVTKQ
jgi:F0F1-type ATP synthase assembly protein I